MAGDWIKIAHVTPDKPEVFAIAEDLGINPNAVIGSLVRLWIWADQQTVIGYAENVTFSLLDRVANQIGFAQALKNVGWLKMKRRGIEFPNFERHNGKTAKNRVLSAKRMDDYRNGASVTKASPEKRREEINTPLTPQGGELFDSQEFKDAWLRWIQYRNWRESTLERHVCQMRVLGEQKSIAAIDFAIRTGKTRLADIGESSDQEMARIEAEMQTRSPNNGI